MKIKLGILILSFLIPVTGKVCFAAGSGTTGASFLKLDIGARSTGMGSAYTAVVNDVSAVYWNPAGLTRANNKHIMFMHSEWISDVTYNFVGYAHPLSKGRVLGLGIFYMNLAEQEARSEKGDNLGTFSAYDLAATISYALKMRGSLQGGISLKIIRESIENENATGFAMDFGGLYQTPIKNISLGLTIQNIGSSMRFIRERYSLPLSLGMGLKYDVSNMVTLALDIKHQPYDRKTGFSIGNEYRPWSVLGIRAGYLLGGSDSGYWGANSNDSLKNLSGLRAGFGLKLFGSDFDYAFVPYGDLGNTHRLSLTIKL